MRLDGRGNRTTYTYDPAGNLLTRKYPDGTRVTFAYDAGNNQTLQVDRTGRVTTTYDELDRASRQVMAGSMRNSATLTYGYDPVGRSRTRNYQGVASELTTYTHNLAGELSVLETTGPHRVSYTYDLAGRRTVTQYPSGVRTSVSYDNTNRIDSVWHLKSPSTVLASLIYTTDPVGNRTRLLDNGSRITYTHDPTYQLTREHRTGVNPYGATHVYDPVGNRKRLDRTDFPAGGWTFTYDNANQVSTRVNGGTANYTFDADGNLLTNPPGGTTGQWDYENRMVKSALGTFATITNDYDASNALTRQYTAIGAARFTNTFDWDRNWNLAGANKNGTANVYIPEPGLYGPIAAKREATTLYFPLYDALGSVISVVKSDGTSMGSQRFDAYGERIATNLFVLSDLGWLGKWGYLTGLAWGPLYVRNRWYDTGLARWLSKDPIDADITNLYRYVHNRSLAFVDPSGLDDLPAVKVTLAYQINRQCG